MEKQKIIQYLSKINNGQLVNLSSISFRPNKSHRFGLGVIKYDNSWNEYDKKGGSYYTNFPKSAFTHYDEVGLYIVNNSNELIAENLLIIRQDVNLEDIRS